MYLQACIHYTLLAGYEAVLAYVFSSFTTMDNKRKKLFYIILALSILAIMSMFHSDTVGNDTGQYISVFQRISHSNLFEYIKYSTYEPGFICYCWILSHISTDPQILFVFTGIIVYSAIGHFLYKYVDAPGVVCYSLVTFLKFDFLLSAQRQAIAISVLLFGYGLMKERKTFKFLLIALIAVLFHYTSILMVLLYFMLHTKTIQNLRTDSTFYIKWLVIVVFIMIFFSQILSNLLRLFPKYNYYIGSAVFDGEPRLAIVLNIIVSIVIYIVSMVFFTYEDKLDKDKNIFRFFTLVSIAITIISSNATVLSRLSGILTLYPMTLYSYAISSKKALYRNNHIILVLLTIITFYLYGLVVVGYRTPDWYTTYPFSFI